MALVSGVDRTRHWTLGPQPSRRLIMASQIAKCHGTMVSAAAAGGQAGQTLRRRNATARKGTKRAWASLSADQDRVTTCPER
jgi:hypothetical protein